jgi:hypothetical protein
VKTDAIKAQLEAALGAPSADLAQDSHQDVAMPPGLSPMPKDCATADEKRQGFYTDTEEKLFLEGLELYGRDWSKVMILSSALLFS